MQRKRRLYITVQIEFDCFLADEFGAEQEIDAMIQAKILKNARRLNTKVITEWAELDDEPELHADLGDVDISTIEV